MDFFLLHLILYSQKLAPLSPLASTSYRRRITLLHGGGTEFMYLHQPRKYFPFWIFYVWLKCIYRCNYLLVHSCQMCL